MDFEATDSKLNLLRDIRHDAIAGGKYAHHHVNDLFNVIDYALNDIRAKLAEEDTLRRNLAEELQLLLDRVNKLEEAEEARHTADNELAELAIEEAEQAICENGGAV